MDQGVQENISSAKLIGTAVAKFNKSYLPQNTGGDYSLALFGP